MYIVDVKDCNNDTTTSREMETLFECFAYFISMAEQMAMAGWTLKLTTKETTMEGSNEDGLVASITLWSDDK